MPATQRPTLRTPATQRPTLRTPATQRPTTRLTSCLTSHCARPPTCLQDIYIARSQGELVLEEELYAALISVYRSPAVLFELTRKHKRS